jgi:hypothetical protein
VDGDTFQPREYQSELADAIMANVGQGRRLTIGLAPPGYGKQNAAIYAAVLLAREHQIPLALTFTPRLNLCGQYEIGYEGPYVREGRRVFRDHDHRDALIGRFIRPRLNHLEHRANANPLIADSWRPPFMIVACYASLVKDMGADGKGLYRMLAQQYKNMFLLHADEAQFCGAAEYGEADAITGGVKAGAYIEELSRYAFHTLLQTGTEHRADGEPLVLCDEHYADPGNGEIRGPLIPHAEGTYGRARELYYLREFEVDYIDDHVEVESLDGKDRTEYELSQSPKYLAQILRREPVWKPLCDKVVERLQERQKIWGGYKGIICCMDQNHADEVFRYLTTRYPHLKGRTLLAISRDQGEALSRLRDFRDYNEKGEPSPYDLLITVRMAFIGYDCKEITVLGILTNYRDKGHLFQQVGRALRVLPDRDYGEQVCWIVAPKDPLMRKFIAWLKDERKRGTRGPGPDGPGPGDPQMYVRDAYATTMSAEGLGDTIEDPLELAEIEQLRLQFGIYEPPTKLKRLKDFWTGGSPPQPPPPPPAQASPSRRSRPLTSKEAIAGLNSDVKEAGKQALVSCGIYGGHARYGDAMNWFYDKVASLSYWASDATTPERAQERLDAAERVLARVRERGELWW